MANGKPKEELQSKFGDESDGSQEKVRRRTRNSIVRVDSLKRYMKMYSISKNEMGQLSLLHTYAASSFSGAAFCLPYVLTGIERYHSPNRTPAEMVMFGAFSVGAIVFTIAGGISLYKRSEVIDTIEKESSAD